VEAKGDEKRGSLGLKMRKVAAIFHAIVVASRVECLTLLTG
jgi:hypothetical protein